MSGADNKAVFLSYASQDAEAARRICEALRAAGVEVWFDQSELVGGDAWDAKIRKQIALCALFVPVISASTQARLEGYFRIEWKLAAQRTHAMAEEKAFLLPVVIDDTRDAEARVPAEFKAVQWTRLGHGVGGQGPDDPGLAAFCGRVKVLLGGEIVAGVPDPGTPASTRPATAKPRRVAATACVAGAVATLAVVALAIWQPWKKSPAAASAQHAAVFPRDPGLKRAWDMVLAANDREEIALAEDIAKAAVALRPTDPEPAIVYAWINNGYLNRGFDTSEERYVLGRRYAERAVQLAPENPQALAALGQFLSFRGADLARAEQLLRRAIELKPDEPRFHRALAWNVLRSLRPADALSVAERSATLFPRDPLVQYELGMLYDDAGRHDDMERALDRALAISPIAGAMMWKAWLAGWVHGDVAAMKRGIEQIPADARLTSRAAVMLYQLARLTQDPAEQANALRALQAVPGTWFRDFWFTGPKALLIGELFAVQGNAELARGQFEQALAEVRREKAVTPANSNILAAECWTLMGLGRNDEARAALRVRQGLPRGAGRRLGGWWHNGIPASLLLGDRELALEQLHAIADQDALRKQVRVALRIDPRMAPFRADPEIAAIVAEPAKAGTQAVAAKADPKSVVVLPFANVSGDKDQEFVSDGLTEEILNALARERDLRVVGRSSAFSFKGRNLPAAEIGRQLGVAQIVEGSVRRIGNLVRIDCTLTRASDGVTTALPRFERNLKEAPEIFALQEDVARAVVEHLTARKSTVAPVAVATKNTEAYLEYLRGREYLAQLIGRWPLAVAAFERAVALDPAFALAWATLGRTRVMLHQSLAPNSGPWLAGGRQAIEAALRLQPELPEALLGRAVLLRVANAPIAELERALDRAAGNGPDRFDVIRYRAVQFSFSAGRAEDAIRLCQRALELDPRNGSTINMLGILLNYAGRYEEADAAYARAFEVLRAAGSTGLSALTNRAWTRFDWKGDRTQALAIFDSVPDDIRDANYWADRAELLYRVGDISAARALVGERPRARERRLWVARCHELAGDAAGARAVYETALPAAEKLRDDFATLSSAHARLAVVYAGLGRKEDALASARRALEIVRPQDYPREAAGEFDRTGAWEALAWVHARSGMLDESIAIVETQTRAGYWRRNYLLLNPEWAELHKHPRFRSIAEKAPL